MAEPERIEGTDTNAAVEDEQRGLPFGFLAYLGVTVSLVFCYGQVLIGLLAPLTGLAAFAFNPDLQAVLMWSFALVTVVGLIRDRKTHGKNLPLIAGIVALAVIVGTLYTFYHVLILVLGYIFLVASAFLNQNVMLGNLNRDVAAQARRLNELNSTLEQRVESQVDEIERLARLKRFLAPEVADLITSEGTESLLDSHRRYIACLFCDIRDFTPLSENIEPEEVMGVLQTYHRRLGKLIAVQGGTIGYRAGDGLMVFFNDPLPCDEPVLEAAKLAIAIRRAFDEMRQDWEKRGYKIGLGIGIASGYATLGVVGYEGRIDYTAFGNVVNVAARLCDRAADRQILINQRALADVDGKVEAEAYGSLDLKGVGKEVETFSLTCLTAGGGA